MSRQPRRRLREVLLGPPRDPMVPDTRKHMALAAFLAWIGIGADGLSSSSYGPAEAFIALGAHSQLALYLAIATALTVFVISLAYNQVIELFPNGGGTYTGIEAVSNNVNMLKEPRVRTGKWTMFLMAVSLSFTAGGIILLYLLWDVQPSHTGQTLNAVVFGDIIESLGIQGSTSLALLTVVLVFEGALLFVAANTGFLGGPAVLANMAVDRWAPNQFSLLSSRLVTRNGVLIMGIAALAILVWTEGYVSLLVVLYTVNVFITFTLSLLGLTLYWWRQRRDDDRAVRRLALSGFALAITASILVVIIVERFLQGGIVTLAVTSIVVVAGALIRRHYGRVRDQAQDLERTFPWRIRDLPAGEPPLDPAGPTAVFFVSPSRGIGIHMIDRVRAMFPDHFRNLVFVGIGTVDSHAFGSEQALRTLQYEPRSALDGLVNYAQVLGFGARWYEAYGNDRLLEMERLALEVRREYPSSVFFASRLIFQREGIWNRWLHHHTPLAMQRILNTHGLELVIVPVALRGGTAREGAEPRPA